MNTRETLFERWCCDTLEEVLMHLKYQRELMRVIRSSPKQLEIANRLIANIEKGLGQVR